MALFRVIAIASCLLAAGDQWVPLFNGKDLTGWKLHGGEKWVVEDGAIVCESTTKKYSYLATERTFSDFRLRLRFKPEAPGNSGVFFHSKITGTDIQGVQVEVDPSPRNLTAGLYESGGRGWLIQPTAEGQKALKPRDWNDLEVLVESNRVVTWLNGVQIVDYTDAAPRFTDGVIALQTHEGDDVKIRWKDIRVQEVLEQNR